MTENSVALVSIDMHKGHLEKKIATLPLPEDRARIVYANVLSILTRTRAQNIPVIHVVTSYRDSTESLSNPFWSSIETLGHNTRSHMGRHNLIGSMGTELMDGLFSSGDILIGNKKRYDSFLWTDLEFVLRNLKTKYLLIVGVNTNSCILATTISASTKDFYPIVIRDGVSTMDDIELQESAFKIISKSFGTVVESAELFSALKKDGGLESLIKTYHE